MKKIFEAINAHSSESEIRYVGGCLRKIFNNEKVDDIDLATNLEPKKMAGVESNAMLLAADIDDKPFWLTVDNDVPEGTKIK